MTEELPMFDGREVVGTQVILTGLGDGLSQAVNTRPVVAHHGERLQFVIEATVSKVRFDPSKDDPTRLVRVHIAKGGTVAIVDHAVVRKVLDAQDKANDAASAKAKIPFDKDIANDADWVDPERNTSADDPTPLSKAAEKALERSRKMAERAAKAKREEAGDA